MLELQKHIFHTSSILLNLVFFRRLSNYICKIVSVMSYLHLRWETFFKSDLQLPLRSICYLFMINCGQNEKVKSTPLHMWILLLAVPPPFSLLLSFLTFFHRIWRFTFIAGPCFSLSTLSKLPRCQEIKGNGKALTKRIKDGKGPCDRNPNFVITANWEISYHFFCGIYVNTSTLLSYFNLLSWTLPLFLIFRRLLPGFDFGILLTSFVFVFEMNDECNKSKSSMILV